MLEVLTPGLVIVLSACACLLVLGFVYSFYAYFLPYLRYKGYLVPPELQQHAEIYIDVELRQSLYSFPNLLKHIPRTSLAECELQSTRWSTSIIGTSISHSPEPTRKPATVPSRTKSRQHSADLNLLRHSLYSRTSPLTSLNENCMTINADSTRITSHQQWHRSRSRSFDALSHDTSTYCKDARRHSAPTLALLRQSILSQDMSSSPTTTTFSFHSAQNPASQQLFHTQKEKSICNDNDAVQHAD